MRVVSTENDWTKYSYTSSAIEKRTGLTREEIRELREYGKEEAYDSPFKREEGIRGIRNEDIQPKPKPGINLKKGAEQSVRRSSLIESPFSVEANEEGVQKASISLPGGFGASYGNNGIGVSGLGFGVEFGEDKSSVELPGGIKITFVNKGCFVITVTTIFNQHAFSDIERKPGCNDDDDDDDDDDEPKPPHCIGSDGKAGTGKPAHQLPECANDGKVHTFYYLTSSINIRKYEYSQGGWGSYYTLFYQHYLFSDVKGKYDFSEDNLHIQEYINSDLNTTKHGNEHSFVANRFVGTYQKFLEVIGEPVDTVETETVVPTLNPYPYTYTKELKKWVVAGINELGYDCNPTGNEGCDSGGGGGGSSNNKKSTSLRPPKPSGGLKSKNKSTEDDEMNCCSRLEKKLGLDAFPGELPVSVLQKEDGEVVKIESLSQMLLWIIDSLDERLGKFPIPITIEDTDPLKEGNQKKEFEIPNIAEMLAEQYGMMFQSTVQSQIQLNIQTNLLIENALLKQSLTRTENILNEIIEYFGWEIKQSTIKVDIPFTPSKSNYDEFLQPSKVDVKRIDRIDDKTNLGLDIILAKLMEAATIIKQTNFRKINPNANVASQIADYARLGLDVYNTIKDNDKKDDQQWENFKEKLSSESFYGNEEKPIIGDVDGNASPPSQTTNRTPGTGSRL
jgi:hypothetical protein